MLPANLIPLACVVVDCDAGVTIFDLLSENAV